jgi:hypothetical protein
MEITFLCASGLPDGVFSNPKCKFGYISEGLAMEDAGIFLRLLGQFSGHLIYFIHSDLVYFMSIWYVVPIKIWQPCCA